MKLRALLWSSCLSVAMVAGASPAVAASAVRACPVPKPNVSYTWDFKAEANNIFDKIQSDAQEAVDHADTLDTPGYGYLSWETEGAQLNDVREDINDIGVKLCRLEAIRRVVSPWQQQVIDGIKGTALLMATNAENAILFLNGHQKGLWVPTYRGDLDNLYQEAANLTHFVGNAVEYPGVSKEYQGLRRTLGTRTSS